MDDKILVAVIAALAALFGSAITQICSYYKDKAQAEIARKKEQQGTQTKVYEELLLALQNAINNGVSSFPAFQIAILKVSLHGDAKTSKAALNYFDTLMKRNHELGPQEHAAHQTKILNAMKNQLSLPEVDSFEIIRFEVKK